MTPCRVQLCITVTGKYIHSIISIQVLCIFHFVAVADFCLLGLYYFHIGPAQWLHQHTDCIYSQHTDWLHDNCSNIMILMYLIVNRTILMFWRFYNIKISTTTMRTCIKPMWNILILNCITNSCIWSTCVTRQGIDYKLSEDDTIMSKYIGVW